MKVSLPAVRFVEAALPAVAAAPAGLSVRLPDDTELRGSSARELAALVRVSSLKGKAMRVQQ